ncbi:hypothetical protein UFOVP53_24 [uncultured Caudovirales phage]|uniref:Uncharacterized protein n=1 Tax=uncultured Caudovirales phage TaxID=2100421 RepID=A0A6J5KXN1_9CAUD|nr:hypothetical protein UFOVP53_24 [uncultured Caudovirales phage]
MDKLEENLLEIKDLLEKGMNNAGIGGPGAVKGGAVLPSISKLPKPGNISTAGKVKIPGQASATKKNPINVAEQTHNKDIKDIKMKEAHANLVMQKSDEVSIADNGQWSLSKAAKEWKSDKVVVKDGTRMAAPEDKKPKLAVVDNDATKTHIQPKDHDAEKEDHDKNSTHMEDRSYLEKPRGKIGVAKEHINSAKTNLSHKTSKGVAHARANLEHAKEVIKDSPEHKKVHEGISNMLESHPDLKVKKSLRDRLNDVLETLDKSNYPGEYDEADNAKRKAKNTGETTGIHTMDSIKAYGGSGPSAAAKEAKEMRAKSKKMPVKIFSAEEIAEMNAPVKKTEGRTTAVPGVSEMGIEVRRSNPESKSYSRVVSPEKHGETAKEIAKENIKQTKEIKPKLP